MINIRDRRKELGLTQRQVAEYVGVSEGAVCQWELGYVNNMKREKIARLAEVLHVSPIELLSDRKESAPAIDAERQRLINLVLKLTPEQVSSFLNLLDK